MAIPFSDGLAEPAVLKCLSGGDPSGWIQVRHLAHEVPEPWILLPGFERNSRVSRIEVAGKCYQSLMKRVIFPYMLQQPNEALLVCKIRNMPPENVAPGV